MRDEGRGVSYKKAGVDIKRMDAFKAGIKSIVKKSFSPQVLRNIGGFGSFYGFPKKLYKRPVLVSSADGVGTKLKIAFIADKHDTVGIDAVAMNVNDILCAGAKPLFFLDYIAFSKLNDKVLINIVKGLNKGCLLSGCSLVGGETAQMPGMYKSGEYDLAGFCVGIVDEADIIDGQRITAADTVLGIESNGLHSNGFSLVRKVLSVRELKANTKELLRPTRIYVKPVLSLLKAFNSKNKIIRGISHITGGAFYDKIKRILPGDVDCNILKESWKPAGIFKLIQEKGGIEDKEMYHTFNMGIGMVLIAEFGSIKKIISHLSRFNLKSFVIGRVIKGRREVLIT